LRAKYLDWCSARIAERFLELTPDEIYELAQRASHESVTTTSGGASIASMQGEPVLPSEWAGELEPIESFRRIVARVTEVLASTLPLPPYEEWKESYRESPGRFDEEMLGFWRETE
jgi:hypothetical protein